MLNFAELRTPPGDGDVLIEPRASRWEAMLEANARSKSSVEIAPAGVPLDELRRRTRGTLTPGRADGPVIMAGHQPAYVHAGVWAKHVVVRHMVARLDAAAVDLVVDNDAPATTALTIPVVGKGGSLTVREVALVGGRPGAAHEGRPPANVDAIEAARRLSGDAMGGDWRESMLPMYLDGLSGAAGARDAVAQHLAGRERIDRALEADLPELRVSRIFGGPFVADLLLDAPRFAEAYNQALDAYRRHQGVRTPNRPVPDLEHAGDRVETALWIYRPGERRRRLWVRRDRDRVELFADEEHAGTLGDRELLKDAQGALASLAPRVIRPRALTLTLWARLLACDLFVHGIGGAKYDRITDGLFRRYYGLEPPSFACVSATLRLPLPVPEASPSDLASARRRRRDLAYNPDRYVAGAPPELLAERETLIRRSAELRERRGPLAWRRETYLAIRRVNARIADADPGLADRMAQEVSHLARRLEERQVAESREYFYALQPANRLSDLAGRLVRAASLPE